MRIPIEELVSGMIIGEDIYTSTGNLIINNGFSVKNPVLVKNILSQNNISKIKVLILPTQSEESDIEKQMKKNICEEIQIFQNNFQDNSTQIRKQIEQVSSGEADSSFFQTFLDTMLSQVEDNYLNVFQLMQKTQSVDDLTFSHCYAVSLTANALGKWLGLSEEDLKELTLAALLSDIGKSMVSDEILFKDSMLSESELIEVQNHVAYTGKLLQKFDLSQQVLSAIQFHHERVDGSGYPLGVTGEDIPYFAKIIAVADVYIALTSKRPYRTQYTPFEAMHIMERDFIDTLDITILTVFLKRIAQSYVGNPVTLSNGKKGKIVFMNPQSYIKPIIKIDEMDHLIDLSLDSNKNISIQKFN